MIKNTIKKGFGIIEVLIASTILIMFLAAGIVLINASYKNVVVGKHRMQAALLANQKLEELRASRDSIYFAGSGNVFGEIAVDDEYFKDNTDVGTSTDYFYHRITTLPPPPGGGASRKIKVEVSWSDYGQKHSITSYAYLYDWQFIE